MNGKVPPRPEVAELMKKFPDTWQIVMMLEQFKQENIEFNKLNQRAGVMPVGWRQRSIRAEDLIQYVYNKEGLGL